MPYNGVVKDSIIIHSYARELLIAMLEILMLSFDFL